MKNLGTTVLVLGLIGGLALFAAGVQVCQSSIEMQEIRSVGGNSVAEAYYQQSGSQGFGFGIGLLGAGLVTIAMTVGFGGLLMNIGEAREASERRHQELVQILEVMGKELLYQPPSHGKSETP